MLYCIKVKKKRTESMIGEMLSRGTLRGAKAHFYNYYQVYIL